MPCSTGAYVSVSTGGHEEASCQGGHEEASYLSHTQTDRVTEVMLETRAHACYYFVAAYQEDHHPSSYQEGRHPSCLISIYIDAMRKRIS